jgi:hypothetical protein
MYGPPSDYIKFEQALLRGGELGGARILQQSTVDEAFRNQIGDLEFPADLPTADPASSCDFRAAPGCATPSSGSTAAPASAPPSTATSCRS